MQTAKIKKITKVELDTPLYDIQTSTKNFFANGMLVHNSNLVVGFDSNGEMYTSRESKSGNRKYSTKDYSDRAADNGFKSAHSALEKIKNDIRSIVDVGEAVELEILFGRQPNAIVYGSNYVAFLRMIPGDGKKSPDQNKIKQLGDLLAGERVRTTVPITTTDDGIDIKTEPVEQEWKFETVSRVDSSILANVNVEKEIAAFENWIEEVGETGIKNGDLLTVNLTKIPKKDRMSIKAAREQAISIANDKFKLPIKEKFLNDIMRKLEPALRDVEVESYEQHGVEGIVLLNPETLEQIKIVDKDVFTAINQFNHAIRNQIKFTVGKRPDWKAALKLPVEEDVFGDMLKRIEQIINIEGIGKYANIKRILRKHAGDSIEHTIENVAAQFSVRDTNEAKQQISKAINEGIHDLNASLDHYKENWNDFNMKVKTGKNVKYSETINNRTLMTFAEVRKEMQDMNTSVQNASTLGDIVVALFGRFLRSIHK